MIHYIVWLPNNSFISATKKGGVTIKYTNEDLLKMQSWPIERKIQVTQLRIMEWYERWNGNVYIAFSGGKDSTVLLDLARRIYPDIPAVFSDTGLEFPEIRKFALSKEGVTRVKPHTPFHDIIKNYGYPVISKQQARFIRDVQNPTQNNEDTRNLRITGYNKEGKYIPSFKLSNKWTYLKDAPFKVSEQCCDFIKKKPMKEYQHKTGRMPITGMMCEESKQRERTWLLQGCNAFDAKSPISNPMAFWTEQNVLRYIKTYNISYCPIYGDIVEDTDGTLMNTGEPRTGCMFCAFGVHLEENPNKFQRMKKTHPKQYEYCMKPVEEGGLGLATVLDYIGVKYE